MFHSFVASLSPATSAAVKALGATSFADVAGITASRWVALSPAEETAAREWLDLHTVATQHFEQQLDCAEATLTQVAPRPRTPATPAVRPQQALPPSRKNRRITRPEHRDADPGKARYIQEVTDIMREAGTHVCQQLRLAVRTRIPRASSSCLLGSWVG